MDSPNMNKIDKSIHGAHPGWLLFKNRLMAQLGINVFRHEKDAHKRRVKVAITIVIAICLLTFVIYCGAAAYGYAYLGMTALIPGIAMVISSLITMFFTVFKANGDLFAFRDYEKVLSLPIPVRTVIYSRLGNMYFWNTFITVLVMTPMGIIYGIFAQPTTGFYLVWIAGVFLVGLLPTILASFIGALITAIASKFRYASAVSSILGIAFVVALMVGSMAMSSGDSGFGKLVDPNTGEVDLAAISMLVPTISEGINHLYPPAKLFTDAAVDGSLLSFLILAVVSIVPYVIFARILSAHYKKINSALTSHVSRGDYKLQSLHQGSMRFALYKKSITRILKSSICATNLLIGCVMAVLFAIATLAVGPEKMLDVLGAPTSMGLVQNGAAYVLAAVISMTNTSAVSLALEGKNIWLVKSLPIPPKVLYDSYLMTNLSFTIPTSLICSVLLSLALKTGPWQTLILVAMPLAFSLFSAVMGILLGNRMAYYDWLEEAHLVKQSLMSVTGMLGGMVLIFICGAIALLQLIPLDTKVVSSTFIILFLISAAAVYIKESERPIKE